MDDGIQIYHVVLESLKSSWNRSISFPNSLSATTMFQSLDVMARCDSGGGLEEELRQLLPNRLECTNSLCGCTTLLVVWVSPFKG